MWTFIKGSQKYRQDLFLRLGNRLAIFEVLEIVAKNYDIPTFVQSNKIRKWTHFKLRQKSKTNFWWLLNMAWLSTPYAKSVKQETWPPSWAVSDWKPQGESWKVYTYMYVYKQLTLQSLVCQLNILVFK